ncbi:hypothetical protein GCM10023321_36660 [Pseudonocardia eucalypti]|uniref:PucR C-terminal helix-turn-helix domain-containing protein n=1 Tax=Pseudonocardia eucalypti TaxID=648755 RepID=A0ABP9QBX7_9PSEU|nr:hypothetical protein [Pseudonocardia eucalypti]
MDNSTALADEVERLRRTVWLQNDLLAALAAENPVSALVGRLAALSKGSAVLYDTTGRVIAATGQGPLRLIWDELSARDSGPQRFSVGRWAVVTRRFLLRGSGFRLAVACRDATLLDTMGPGLLATAERVLSAANAVRALTMSQERAEAARLVSALYAGVSASRVRQTWDRLRPFRFRVGAPLRVVTASPVDAARWSGRRGPADMLLEEAQLAEVGLILSEGHDPDVLETPLVAVLPDGPEAAALLEPLRRTHLVGVSGPFADLTVSQSYFGEALTAWRVVIRRRDRGGAQTLVRLDEVDFATWLLTRRDDAALADRYDRHFGELVGSTDLAETVITYLACDQDVKLAAEHLIVHPNTVRYRLRRVEALIGAPITAAATVANLYLAFQDSIHARHPHPADSVTSAG